jgi:hypothetical protein
MRLGEIWGPLVNDYEDYCLLGCDTAASIFRVEQPPKQFARPQNITSQKTPIFKTSRFLLSFLPIYVPFFLVSFFPPCLIPSLFLSFLDLSAPPPPTTSTCEALRLAELS